MNGYNILNYEEIFSILIFTLVMIMITEKLSPSYATPINYNQFNSGHLYDDMKRQVDDNAFSNLSRNMTFSAGDGGNVSSPTNSIGPNFATGDINNNSPNNVGPNGMNGNDISSGSIFTQHGSSSSSAHMWLHRFH